MILTNIETVPGMNIVAQYGLVTAASSKYGSKCRN